LLSDEDKALLLRVSGLLEELLETVDVLEDEEAIKEAEEDVMPIWLFLKRQP